MQRSASLEEDICAWVTRITSGACNGPGKAVEDASVRPQFWQGILRIMCWVHTIRWWLQRLGGRLKTLERLLCAAFSVLDSYLPGV